MSSQTETMPMLAQRADASYLDFVEGFREYILGKGADFEDRLNEELLAEERRRGRKWQELEEIRAHVHGLPLGRLRDRLARTQQEMKWHTLKRDRKSTRLNSSHVSESRMPSSA